VENEIKRENITDEEFREILDCETHHNHPIIEDEGGTYRWKQNPRVRQLVDKCGLNELVELLFSMGYDKNSEVFRKMYRDMGYSLYGYWEVFYWEMNNEKSQEYIDKRKILNRDLKLNDILND
jgi:hypothetical protein